MATSAVFFTFLSQQLPVGAPGPMPDREIIVEAGDFDRQHTLVKLELQEHEGKRRWKLKDARGRAVPYQIDARGRAAFFVEKLGHGEKASFRLIEDSAPPAPGRDRIKVETKKDGAYRVLADGRPVLEFQPHPAPEKPKAPINAWRGGFIHPIFSPSGVALTDGVADNPSAPAGVWSFWNRLEASKQKLEFPQVSGKGGSVQLESAGPTWNGSVHGGFEARQIFLGGQAFAGRTMLRDEWRVQVYAGAPGRPTYYVFDLDSHQAVQGNVAVDLPKDENGGIAVRGRATWERGEPGAIRFTSEAAADSPRARFACMGGPAGNGKTAGLAILGHPGNFDSPQPLGDMGKAAVINFCPNRLRPVPLKEGSPMWLSYRFVAMDGKPDGQVVNRLWNDFAFPPRAWIQPSGLESWKKATSAKR